ncbi:MAG: bifunctional 2-C-methyl-D-erythritol 4-phosphate cytidylyltransferase/2-C-methyl-D-erythritol 2,4-cyclodiphosphate synthase [Flavobacteriaceae bacterium]
MGNSSRLGVVLVAGGKGNRARISANELPKQYREVGGRPVIAWTAAALHQAFPDAAIQPVIAAGDETLFAPLRGLPGLRDPAVGGVSRQHSVLAGLERLAKSAPDHVLVHDAVRPFVTTETARVVFAQLLAGAVAVVPAVRPADTLRRTADGAIVDRETLLSSQTPQGFRFDLLLDAHRKAADAGLSGFTDDAAVMQWAGYEIEFVDGDPGNSKITTSADLAIAESRLADRGRMETRTGQGYDVHRLVAGRPLWLGGINIPHDRGLAGHSDADAGLHVLTDALLGAIGEGDIGRHFPPSDPQWKDATSDRFLRFAAELVSARGGRIVHLDLTIIAEAPKIGPHVEGMRDRIAGIAGISTSRVSVKATTSERLGFVGREEGIATMAVANVELPQE